MRVIVIILKIKDLNKYANGILTTTNKTNNNKIFTATTLSRMIRNIKYKGYYCGKKTEIENYGFSINVIFSIFYYHMFTSQLFASMY